MRQHCVALLHHFLTVLDKVGEQTARLFCCLLKGSFQKTQCHSRLEFMQHSLALRSLFKLPHSDMIRK